MRPRIQSNIINGTAIRLLFYVLCTGCPVELYAAEPFVLTAEPDRPRSYVWPQLASMVLPGFDQWYEGQHSYALTYSGLGLGGFIFSSAYSVTEDKSLSEKERENQRTHGFRERVEKLGASLYQQSGMMSTYHSFRSAVESRRSTGEFSFLQHAESPTDLLLAPFDASLLLRPTTFIPVFGYAALLAVLYKNQFENSDQYLVDPITGKDVGYGALFGYGAGVAEEAAVRGWWMPVVQEWTDNSLISNGSTALLFSATHNGGSPVILAVNLYLGWLCQNNAWRLGESIFVHAWTDFMANVFIFSWKHRTAEEISGEIQRSSVIWLPELRFAF